MEKARSWVGGFLSTPEAVPISFTYGGSRIGGIPADWHPIRSHRRLDANLEEVVWQGHDDRTGLTVRVDGLRYLDYPVVEWTGWLTHDGPEPTPLIEDLWALDASFAGGEPVLHHSNGDFYSEDGYTPRETAMRPGDVLAFAPHDGRPCDGAFPYFRLVFPGAGLTMAIGWPAQWSASFRTLSDGVHVRAGQETTHLRLRPGERMRTPRMTVMAWTGDATRSVNLWRRWYLDHVLPRPNGRPLEPKLACSCNGGGEEFTQATEANQLAFMEAFERLGIDYDVWWIDAGWFPCRDEHGERHWVRTGTWEPDPERFPRGLKPIADRAARHGAALLLWFEPERVMRGSRLDVEHPEWLLRTATAPGADDWLARNGLADLGNPACRRWLTDHVSTLIRENGVGVYRQDFNFPPLPYWRDNDAPDRRGMHENLHVQGYLQFWDDLLAAHPGLWIDSCASGGRRNDLETMRRSVPLHYSDYGYGIHPVKLAFHHTLFAWIPYFKESTLSWDTIGPEDDRWFDRMNDSYSYHAGLAAMLATSFDIRRDDYDHRTTRRMIALWRRAAGLLLHGDYHALTPFSRDPAAWVAWQFDRPETGEGFLQAIRHRACPADTITVRPEGLCAGTTYLFENPETGVVLERDAASLGAEGFTLCLPPRSGAVWFYRLLPERDARGGHGTSPSG